MRLAVTGSQLGHLEEEPIVDFEVRGGSFWIGNQVVVVVAVDEVLENGPSLGDAEFVTVGVCVSKHRDMPMKLGRHFFSCSRIVEAVDFVGKTMNVVSGRGRKEWRGGVTLALRGRWQFSRRRGSRMKCRAPTDRVVLEKHSLLILRSLDFAQVFVVVIVTPVVVVLVVAVKSRYS